MEMHTYVYWIWSSLFFNLYYRREEVWSKDHPNFFHKTSGKGEILDSRLTACLGNFSIKAIFLSCEVILLSEKYVHWCWAINLCSGGNAPLPTWTCSFHKKLLVTKWLADVWKVQRTKLHPVCNLGFHCLTLLQMSYFFLVLST